MRGSSAATDVSAGWAWPRCPPHPREEAPATRCDRAASMWLLTGPGGEQAWGAAAPPSHPSSRTDCWLGYEQT